MFYCGIPGARFYRGVLGVMFVRYRLYTALLASSLALFFPVAASAATITIINLDSAGVGLNDTTPATPVGGNTGTTKGAQALQTWVERCTGWRDHTLICAELEWCFFKGNMAGKQRK